MDIKTFIVDAFTDQPFKGNPAGVCLLENEIDDVSMLSIASSKVIFSTRPELERIHVVNIQNLDLIISKAGDAIVMQFPIYETEPATYPKALTSALGLEDIKNSVYNKETNILLLEIEDSHVLESLNPNFEALYNSHDAINGVLVTAPSKRKNYDFESRYFLPWSGTNEDPVTGGTHTFLAKYWSERPGKKKCILFNVQSAPDSWK